MTPEAAMRLALAQARGALGHSFPNPAVGAVVFRGDRVLGRGRTRSAGGAHAEVVALDAALRRYGARAVRGASMAVTLEPCSHTGKTGPCVDRLVAAGLRRVFVGHVDPHPRVAGRGLRQLRRAGVEVCAGVLEAECREQHRGFLCSVQRGRPFVVLKLAATLDGRIATARGESRWITSPEGRAAVHRLRARMDGIVVGSGTALADDPELTVRRGGRVVHRPLRIVVDASLRVGPGARLYRGEAGWSWVLCSGKAPAARRRALGRAGVVLIDVPRRGRHIDLKRGLAKLAERGLTQVLVEGGGRLAAALLREDLVDEVHWYVAPRLIGCEGIPALGELGLRALADAVALGPLSVRRVGPDLHVWGSIRRRGVRARSRR
jgi:diaminohydroxyphosphoribosylaminopyrimidine deaminase/5-amino-6-(5-phosphoribosylamino)uracil reductase